MVVPTGRETILENRRWNNDATDKIIQQLSNSSLSFYSVKRSAVKFVLREDNATRRAFERNKMQNRSFNFANKAKWDWTSIWRISSAKFSQFHDRAAIRPVALSKLLAFPLSRFYSRGSSSGTIAIPEPNCSSVLRARGIWTHRCSSLPSSNI